MYNPGPSDRPRMMHFLQRRPQGPETRSRHRGQAQTSSKRFAREMERRNSSHARNGRQCKTDEKRPGYQIGGQ